MNYLKEKWDSSYNNNENFIFYPKEEIVKFLNRFIKKKTGFDKFKTLIKTDNNTLKGLDLGCGIGRQTLLLYDFGIEAYGVDISEVAINNAIQMAKQFGFPEMQNRFKLLVDTNLPFSDNFFDIVISDSVLDSMKFDIAKEYLKEIDRVLNGFLYVSLISGIDSHFDNEFDGEIEQKTYEKGTIQSYFTKDKIEKLIEGTSFKIQWGELHKHINLIDNSYIGRYYLVLSNKGIK